MKQVSREEKCIHAMNDRVALRLLLLDPTIEHPMKNFQNGRLAEFLRSGEALYKALPGFALVGAPG